ncbi:MAG: NAD(P)/FAD-dependent oxidoreductase, partial [Thalassobaculaceae bacterium]
LTAALELAGRGYTVAVLEAHQVAWGASGRSGGQIISGFNKDPAELAALVGRDDAQKLSDMAVEAVADVKARVAAHDIACDLADGHYHVGLKPRHTRELAAWQAALEAVGYGGCTLITGPEVVERVASPLYTSALYDPRGGHLHPLNYTLGLAAAAAQAGVALYEDSPVTRLVDGAPARVETAEGAVTADYVIVAANAYLGRLIPDLACTIMPVGTYIAATEPLGEDRARGLIRDNAAIADINFVLDYFRLSGDHRMLFGGRVSYSRRDPGNIAAAMGNSMTRVFPQLADARVTHAWGGFVAITVNRLPHLGRLSANYFFAHGFSGQGVALTGMAGKLIAEAVAGTAERFDVFGRIPHRRFPGGPWLRTPALVLAMAYYRLRDLL